MNCLTPPRHRAHNPAVAETTATGFDSLSGAAMSRTVFAMRLFCRLGVPSYGRPGRGSRKARRCSTGLSTPFGAAHPFDSGMAVQNRNWSNTMQNTPASPALTPAAICSASTRKTSSARSTAPPRRFSGWKNCSSPLPAKRSTSATATASSTWPKWAPISPATWATTPATSTKP